MSATKYRKLPVEIEAWQLTAESGPELWEWADSKPMYDPQGNVCGLRIYTLEGDMKADFGDWIIRGVKGEFYPCKPDIFAATYELASVAEERALDSIEARNPGIDREEVRRLRAGGSS